MFTKKDITITKSYNGSADIKFFFPRSEDKKITLVSVSKVKNSRCWIEKKDNKSEIHLETGAEKYVLGTFSNDYDSYESLTQINNILSKNPLKRLFLSLLMVFVVCLLSYNYGRLIQKKTFEKQVEIAKIQIMEEIAKTNPSAMPNNQPIQQQQVMPPASEESLPIENNESNMGDFLNNSK